MGKLENKVAVITGGSSGIGLATARLFAEEGAFVYLAGRRELELQEAVRQLGDRASAVVADVTSSEDLNRLWHAVRLEHGGVDTIVTAAGIVEHGTLAESTPEHFDRTFAVNTRGTFITVQAGLPLLRAGGAVVLFGSSIAHVGLPMYTAYAASKAAVRSFGRSWAAELKHRDIRVNVLSPGATDTPMIDGQFPSREIADGARAMMREMIPMGRLGRPEELARAALFLASDESSYMTGFEMVVDGGQIEL